MNYEELLTTFSLLYEQVSSASTDVSTRGQFINLACQNITNRFQFSWRIKTLEDTVSGTYTLPTDFHHHGFVKDSVLIAGDLWTEIRPDEVSFLSSDSQVFYKTGNSKDGWKIYFPKEQPEGTIIFSYFMKHPDLVDSTDETIIPDGECICNIAVGRFLKSEGEGDEAMTWLQDGENGIMDMNKADKATQPVRRTKRPIRTGIDKNSLNDMY